MAYSRKCCSIYATLISYTVENRDLCDSNHTVSPQDCLFYEGFGKFIPCWDEVSPSGLRVCCSTLQGSAVCMVNHILSVIGGKKLTQKRRGRSDANV